MCQKPHFLQDNSYFLEFVEFLLFQAVSKDTVNAEEIDGYRGNEDLDRILEFIEAKPEKSEEEKTTKSNVAKRNRKSDKKAKRSRTPSAAPSISKETSAERQQVRF